MMDKMMPWFMANIFSQEWAANKEDGLVKGRELLGIYAGCLGDKKFVCGTEPSIVDFNLHWLLKIFKLWDASLVAEFATLEAFFATVEALPGVAEAAAA